MALSKRLPRKPAAAVNWLMVGNSGILITIAIYKGELLVETVTLREAMIKIGKISTSHLQLQGEGVGRMHAVIETSPAGEVSIIDLDSLSGTFVNGSKVRIQRLHPGDELRIGEARLVVTFEAAASVPAEPAPAPEKPPHLSREDAVARTQFAADLAEQGQFDEALRILRAETLPAFEALVAAESDRSPPLIDIENFIQALRLAAGILGRLGQFDEALRIQEEQIAKLAKGCKRPVGLRARVETAILYRARRAPGDVNRGRLLLDKVLDEAGELPADEVERIRELFAKWPLEP